MFSFDPNMDITYADFLWEQSKFYKGRSNDSKSKPYPQKGRAEIGMHKGPDHIPNFL